MRLFFLCICCIITFYSSAQVRDIKSRVEEDKTGRGSAHFGTPERREPAYWEPPDIGEGFAAFLVGSLVYYTAYGAYRGLDYGQYLMQLRRREHPETFSLQGDINSAFDFSNAALLLSPSVRGNWGLFASEARFQYTRDVTDNLSVVDWQVLMLRFPISNLKLEYGIGFSHIVSPSKTYFEQSVGLDWCFFERKVTLQGQYRWSQNTGSGNRYRYEAGASIDYEMASLDRLRFCPLAGIIYQNYFDSTRFRFYRLGLRVRMF